MSSRLRKLSLHQLILLWSFAGACIWFHFFEIAQWVPLLDGANLLIHEAGHPLLGLLVPSWNVYGGTIFQLVLPWLFSWRFYQQGEVAGQAFGWLWLAENLLNIARYMADARQQQLPLVGGGMHDWYEILSRWGLLDYDEYLAKCLRLVALLLMGYVCFWLLQLLRGSHE